VTRRLISTLKCNTELAQILRASLQGPTRREGGCYFRVYRTGEERILTDIRKLLDRVTERVGTLHLIDRGARRRAEPGAIRTKVFRLTYITARLQTLDRGVPVSPWTVAREVGHSGTGMIERVYGHLGGRAPPGRRRGVPREPAPARLAGAASARRLI